MTKTLPTTAAGMASVCPTYCGVWQNNNKENRLVGAGKTTTNRWWLTAWQGQMDEAGQKVQTSSCEINT